MNSNYKKNVNNLGIALYSIEKIKCNIINWGIPLLTM